MSRKRSEYYWKHGCGLSLCPEGSWPVIRRNLPQCDFEGCRILQQPDPPALDGRSMNQAHSLKLARPQTSFLVSQRRNYRPRTFFFSASNIQPFSGFRASFVSKDFSPLRGETKSISPPAGKEGDGGTGFATAHPETSHPRQLSNARNPWFISIRSSRSEIN